MNPSWFWWLIGAFQGSTVTVLFFSLSQSRQWRREVRAQSVALHEITDRQMLIYDDGTE